MRISDWSSDVCSSDLLRRWRISRRHRRPEAERGRRGRFRTERKCPSLRRGPVGYQMRVRHNGSCYGLLVNDRGGRGAAMLGSSEVHTSELQSLMRISYAVFCLNKKNYAQPLLVVHNQITSDTT